MISDPLVVYRWDDGSHLQIVPGMSWNDDRQANVVAWMIELVRDGSVSASLRQNASASLPFMAVGPSLEDDVDRSGPWLRGFLLHPSLRPSTLGYALLVTGTGKTLLRVGPTWVSDERWDTRYDVARRDYVSSATTDASNRPFLGVVAFLSLRVVATNTMDGEDVRWIARVGHPERVVASWLPFEETIDEVLEKLFVRPERDREFWASQNALRGTWVAPSEEEVEILSLLGESSPLLWPADRLYAWYLERRGP